MLFSHKKTMMFMMVIAMLMVMAVPSIGREYKPITSIDLGVDNLTLEVGESYTFQVSYQPKEPYFYALDWYITDSSVISIDAETFTVTAQNPGEARILAESLDGVSYDICNIVVSGNTAKAAYELKSGDTYLTLSDTDRQKITSSSINRYLDFLGTSNFTAETYTDNLQRVFNVSATVTPGTEESEAQLALGFGMYDVRALNKLHVVTLNGTLEQILKFAADNSDLIEIFELPDSYIDDPITEEFTSDSVAKAMNLGGNVENLTAVSKAHALGLTGAGTTVAIIDTGINASHEQFSGRIVAQACYGTNSGSTTDNGVTKKYRSVCTSSSSAVPGNAYKKAEFNHGSHVAGIAAGRDGIAPDANIIAIQAFSELTWTCTKKDPASSRCDNYSSKNKLCCGQIMENQDELSAYNYLLNVADTRNDIAALNMSYGSIRTNGTGFSSSDQCDYETKTCSDFMDCFEKYSVNGTFAPADLSCGNNGCIVTFYTENYSSYSYLWDKGIVPVASTGNDALSNGIGDPGCNSNTVSVGALADLSSPKLASYSNHIEDNELVSITAPGTNLLSAFYAYEDGASSNSCSAGGNCYGHYSGTSMAAPVVTGAMALVKQAYPYNNAQDYLNFLQGISTLTVNEREGGETFSTDTKVVNFNNLEDHLLEPLEISQSDVTGYSNSLKIVVPRDYNATGYRVSVMKVEGRETVSPTVTVSHSGDKTTIQIKGSEIENGKVYKITIFKYHSVGGVNYQGNRVVVYGAPNEPVTRLVAQPKNGSVILNARRHTNSDGIYYRIYKVSTNTLVKSQSAIGTNTVQLVKGLENGKLYYVMAQPYIKYNNQFMCWGTQGTTKVYFIPLSDPTGIKLTFTNSTTAQISCDSDTTISGIRVLYRANGGALVNGCENGGNKCSVNNLNQSNSYEFYVMKFKTANSKRHYGPGVTVIYNPIELSTMSAPQNPVIALVDGGIKFLIVKSEDAEGISVLYKENEGNFSLACEKTGTWCIKNLDTTQVLTFYIMQYKIVDGKKVYSPGITVKNVYGPKSIDGIENTAGFAVSNETVDTDELSNALDGYMTNEDLIAQEAYDVIGIDWENDYTESVDEDIELPDDSLMDETDGFGEFIDDGIVPSDEDFIDVPTGDAIDEYIPPVKNTVDENVEYELPVDKNIAVTVNEEDGQGIAFYTISDEPVQLDAPSFRNK